MTFIVTTLQKLNGLGCRLLTVKQDLVLDIHTQLWSTMEVCLYLEATMDTIEQTCLSLTSKDGYGKKFIEKEFGQKVGIVLLLQLWVIICICLVVMMERGSSTTFICLTSVPKTGNLLTCLVSLFHLQEIPMFF